jgi:hypothetical protein
MRLLNYLLAVALLAAVAVHGDPLPQPPRQAARDALPTAPAPRDPASR